mgnify:CR=1 FL=1
MPRLLLIIDNYDSFTWNLFQLLAAHAPPDVALRVVRNDAHDVETLLAWSPWRVVLSPGPGDPSRAGVSCELLQRAATPTLGVCLGHQCLGAVFGARVRRGAEPVHGKASPIVHDGSGLFEGVPSPFRAARYHSLVVDAATVPACLEVTACADDGAVMGLRHRTRPFVGVQFHPESVLTEHGPTLARNFLDGRL